MKARILITLLLASGLAVAQTQQPGSSPGSSDQNQPTQAQPSTQDQQQPASPSTQDQQQPATPSTQDQQQSTPPTTPPTTPSDQSNPSAATSSGNSQETVVRGCLKQSGGNWVVSQNGQDTPVSGDDSMLKPHDGHEVEVHGTATSGGGLQVTSVTMVSESCTGGGNDQSAAPSSAAAAAGAAGAAASGQADAQTSDQNPPASAGAAGSTATKTLTPEEQAQQSKNIANLPHGGSSLPQSGSPLPLIGLLGLGSLVTGLIVRKK